MNAPAPTEADVQGLKNFIGGAWVAGSGEATIDLVDPTTETVIARQPAGSAADADAAVGAAAAAQPAWSRLPLKDRLAALERMADTLEKHIEELADLEYREMGKPLDVGRDFLRMGIAVLRGSLEDARRYPFVEEVANDEAGQTVVVRHPLGVVAQIVPWNFTVTTVLLGLGPLLAAGNTVVLKPSEKAPLSAVRMVEVAGLPPGVLNLLLGDRRAGEPLADHLGVRLIHFTGSVEAGRVVGVASARHLHRAVLELGGKDPVLIDADVDPRAVAAAVAFGAFVNTGQICTSMERIYVHRAVADEFLDALVTQAREWTFGDGREPGVRMGPLVDERQRRIVHSHVTDAVARGATVLIGGTIPDRPGFFYPATVLTEVEDDMLIMTEETFGPVAPVRIVVDFDEALERASRSRFGLGATVYSNDLEHIERAHALPAALVWVNQWQGGGLARTAEPTGESGLGATGGRAAFDAATRPVSIIRTATTPHFRVPKELRSTWS